MLSWPFLIVNQLFLFSPHCAYLFSLICCLDLEFPLLTYSFSELPILTPEINSWWALLRRAWILPHQQLLHLWISFLSAMSLCPQNTAAFVQGILWNVSFGRDCRGGNLSQKKSTGRTAVMETGDSAVESSHFVHFLLNFSFEIFLTLKKE